MEKLELYFPLKPWSVNQPFGNKMPIYTSLGLDGHNGIDAFALDGTKIYAAHDGVVTFAGEDGSAGMGVVLRTNEKKTWKGGEPAFFKTLYWHMRKDGVLVRPGQKIKAGDLIGLADNTGLSTGSHLHFGLKPVYQGEADWEWWNVAQTNGYKGAIDPAPYFNGYAAQDAQTLLSTLQTIIAKLTEAVRIAALHVKK